MSERAKRNKTLPGKRVGPVSVRPAGSGAVTAVICLVLVVMVFVVFGRTIGHDFVNYDDGQYIYENPRISNGVSLDGISWAFTHVHADNWHPLTTVAHMVDCQLFGVKPAGHHFMNVLLHAVAAVLLFLALRQLTGALWLSAAVAALFAIHPLRVGSVAWASELKDVLSGVFFMLILLAYARYAQSSRPATGRYLTVIILFALGLLCKPTLVTVPFVLLLLDCWPLRRVAPIPQLLIEKIPLFLLSAASCLATMLAQERAVIEIHLLSFGDRVANALISYLVYIGQMFWPASLAAVYPYPESGANIAQILVALSVLLALTVAFFIWRQKYPYLLVGWLWFLGVLVPMIGIIQVGAQARADRYTYLSQIGLYILMVWGVTDLFGRWRFGRQILAGGAVLILIALMAVAHSEAAYWKNSEVLWNHVLANTTRNHIALTNLGDIVMKKGRLDEAIVHLRKALEIYPNSPEANNNLGYALGNQGKWAESISYYRTAIQTRPNYPKAHNNLAISLSETGKKEEALAEFHKALKQDEAYADAHCNLGVFLLQLGRREEAIAELLEALRLKPDDEEVRTQLRQLGVQR